MRKAFALAALLLSLSFSALAQGPSVLKPPKGSPLAIVIFEDLQCPQCSRVSPLVEEASKTYKIPLVRYDFPLPMHNWSYDAAVMARFFDKESKNLGDAFRDYIFQHQMQIFPSNLRTFADKFAAEHKTALPFVVDPKGELSALVNADRDLGKRVGIEHTPTVYIVSSKPQSRPYLEVTDTSQLFQSIDSMRQ